MSPVVFFFILLTRFIFISPHALFFDSPEYLQSFVNKNLLGAMTVGHLPTHPLFILVGRLGIPISVASVFSGILTCVFLYLLIQRIFDKKTALFSILIYSFLPYVWISQTNFTIESILVMFFAGAYYFLYEYFRKKQNKFWAVSLLFFTAALLTHFSILIFSVSFFGLLALFGFTRKNFTKVVLFIFTSLFLSVSIYCLLFYFAGNLSREVVLSSFINHLGERADLLRNVRNALLILLRSSTLPVLCLAVYGAFLLRRKTNKLMFLIIFFLPFLYSSQFWHVGLFGRTGLPA
ncbi:MAG: glycosyltransferase family 39 protein, partial [bacterium]|nr:glycosyltransferase family 39 protein [bacterium]